MSNVLIGIIGVILFIGLALAGALFLGPRFQESSNSSKAAVLASQLQQVSDAAKIYEINTGEDLTNLAFNTNVTALLIPSYLKTMPANPVISNRYWAADANGSGPATPIRFFYTPLGTGDAAREICVTTFRNAGWPNPDAATALNFVQATSSGYRLGCFVNGSGSYSAFIKA